MCHVLKQLLCLGTLNVIRSLNAIVFAVIIMVSFSFAHWRSVCIELATIDIESTKISLMS